MVDVDRPHRAEVGSGVRQEQRQGSAAHQVLVEVVERPVGQRTLRPDDEQGVDLLGDPGGAVDAHGGQVVVLHQPAPEGLHRTGGGEQVGLAVSGDVADGPPLLLGDQGADGAGEVVLQGVGLGDRRQHLLAVAVDQGHAHVDPLQLADVGGLVAVLDRLHAEAPRFLLQLLEAGGVLDADVHQPAAVGPHLLQLVDGDLLVVVVGRLEAGGEVDPRVQGLVDLVHQRAGHQIEAVALVARQVDAEEAVGGPGVRQHDDDHDQPELNPDIEQQRSAGVRRAHGLLQPPSLKGEDRQVQEQGDHRAVEQQVARVDDPAREVVEVVLKRQVLHHRQQRGGHLLQRIA